MMRRVLLMFAVAITLGSVAARLCAQQTYTLTDIAPCNEVIGPFHLLINASGSIAGYMENASGNDTAFVWTPSAANAATGTFAWLPVPSGTRTSVPHGINSAGLIIGTRTYQNGTYKIGRKTYPNYVTVPVEWQPNGSNYVFVALPASAPSSAINDAGEIVGGTSLFVNGQTYPLPGVQATSINQTGQVVGMFSNTATTGYLWTPSTPNGTTGSYVTFPFYPSQINDLGQVVGFPVSLGISNGPPAFFSTSGGTQFLAPTYGNANGINNLTQIVGDIDLQTGAGAASVWDSTHGLRYLNDTTQFTIVNGAGWNLIWAWGINDFGQIVGFGFNPAGAERYFLLTPQ
jgi:uncharacterized membrane protein